MGERAREIARGPRIPHPRSGADARGCAATGRCIEGVVQHATREAARRNPFGRPEGFHGSRRLHPALEDRSPATGKRVAARSPPPHRGPDHPPVAAIAAPARTRPRHLAPRCRPTGRSPRPSARCPPFLAPHAFASRIGFSANPAETRVVLPGRRVRSGIGPRRAPGAFGGPAVAPPSRLQDRAPRARTESRDRAPTTPIGPPGGEGHQVSIGIQT